MTGAADAEAAHRKAHERRRRRREWYTSRLSE
jgi:hypothetical protein